MRLNWRVLIGVAAIAAIAGWLGTRLIPRPDVDAAALENDLEEIANVLRRDQTIEVDVIPPPVATVDIPSTLPYRRTVQFWQPAFAAASKGRQ